MVAVVGTDTGVGKTRTAAAICQAVRGQGLRPAAFKPVETGIDIAGAAPADWKRLAGACDWHGERASAALGRAYPLPAAPLVAARKAGRPSDWPALRGQLLRLAATADLTVVEGAGGLLVPCAPQKLWADILTDWQLPALVVGRLGLGTINHTLLTLSELARREIPVLGLVLSADRPPGPESAQTPALLAEFGAPAPIVVPHDPIASPARVAAVLDRTGLIDRLLSQTEPREDR